MGKRINIEELIWPKINETGRDIILKEQDNPIPIVIKPGERIILPKQRQVLREMMRYDMLLYGGAGGGGKSYILGWAPPYHCIWFNQKYREKHGQDKLHRLSYGMFAETRPALRTRQITNIKKWYPEWMGNWKESTFQYIFSDKLGAGVIWYIGLDDPIKLRSNEFAGACVEESTIAGDKEDIMHVKNRLREPKLTGICEPFMVLATNPGGQGNQWHRVDFVVPITRIKPQKSQLFTDDETGEAIVTKGNRFIQCLPQENPFLPKSWFVDLELNHSESQRDAMLFGKWDVSDGMYFTQWKDKVHFIRSYAIPEEWQRFRGIDIGGTHPFGCVWAAQAPPDEKHPNGFIVFYREYEQISRDVYFHKRNINDLTGSESISWTAASHDLFHDHLGVRTNISTLDALQNDDAAGPGLNLTKCINDRKEGWRSMGRMISFEYEYVKKDGYDEMRISRYPELYVMDTCPGLASQIKRAEVKPTDPEDIFKPTGVYKVGHGDDLLDPARYLVMQLGAAQPLLSASRASRRNFDPYRIKNNSSSSSSSPLSRI